MKNLHASLPTRNERRFPAPLGRVGRERQPGTCRAALVAVLVLLCSTPPARVLGWDFTNITSAANINYTHGYIGGPVTLFRDKSGGVAAGDYDNDGLVDFYAVRGNIGSNVLYR
ncbi:MAG: hypothetical protein ACKVU1_02935, partial [bacterium]